MLTCPSCSHENPDEQKFCGDCGIKLEAAPVREERKNITALFCDLVGFTARSERADPEDVQAVLRSYHGAARREIERFSGTIEKFIGDAVVAVWGAPVTHEDDPERAVRAALRILEAIDELNDSEDLAIAVRIGINSGEAVVALEASPERGEGFVTGDVVNTASRLQGVAQEGAIVVGEATYRATTGLFEYETLDPVRLKGKAEPVSLWRPTAARARYATEFERTRTPFVGREEDIAALQLSFTRCLKESSVQLVTIVGEPGVGKSRLLGEFFGWVDDRPEVVTWRQGRCLPYGDGITFWALGEIVKAQAGILDSDSPEAAGGKLDQVLQALLEDRAERIWLRAQLATLVGAKTDQVATEREESFTAWRRFLEALASPGPLIMVVEDLHWADEAMLAFVEHLAEWARGVPLLLACSGRPELYDRRPGWGGGIRNAVTIELSPLSGEDTARLVAALLEQPVLPAEVQEALLERSGGNPLYVEEFVKMLLDRGLLERRGKVLSLAADQDLPPPETVQALIAARLDTLSPERKTLLQDAAVIGRVFWSGAVAEMSGRDDGPVREDLHELAKKELIRASRTSSAEGQMEYAFWHALVREVCYSQIPRAVRAGKHRAAAAWIERTTGERIGDVAELLAYHYGEALELSRAAGTPDDPELIDAAVRSLVLAGDRAMFLDVGRAEVLLQRALQIAPADHPERVPALLRSSDAARERGRSAEALHFAEEAARAARASRDVEREGEALVLRSMVHNDLRDEERERRALDEALALLEAAPPGRALCLARVWKADHLLRAGEPTLGIEEADKAIALATELSLRIDEIIARRARASSSALLGDLGAIGELQAVVAMSEEFGGRLLGMSLNYLAGAQSDLAGPAAAADTYSRNITFCEQRGFVFGEMVQRASILGVLFDLGRWPEVPREAEKVIEWAETNGYRSLMGSAKLSLVQVLILTGHLTQASSLDTEVLESAREANDEALIASAVVLAAAAAVAEGSYGQAREFVSEYDHMTRGNPNRNRELPELMRACHRVGERALATRLLEGADSPVPRHQHAAAGARAVFVEMTGDLAEAVRLHHGAAEGWAGFGHVYEEGQSLLGEGRCLVTLERRDEAADPIGRARQIFTDLGTAPLVAEVDALIGTQAASNS